MLLSYKILNIAYYVIYGWIVLFCLWNVFVQKNRWRAIGAAMVAVPFALRMLLLR